MRSTLYGFLFWMFIIVSSAGFLWHAKQPIEAPVAGLTENITHDEYVAQGGLKLEFSPEMASVGTESDGQVYLEVVYLKGLWTRRIYIREGFCIGFDCMQGVKNALAYQLADGGPIRVQRFNLHWGLDGTYKNAGFWDLPFER